MAITPPHLVQDTMKSYKGEDYYYPHKPYKSNARSLFAFFFFIFIYISIFYAFNLSPSTDLLYNTKFLFVISNTLVLIIAADYSSSKDQIINAQEEYMMHSQPQIATSSFVSQYPREIIKKTIDHQTQSQNIENPGITMQAMLKSDQAEPPSVDEIFVQEKRIVHMSKGDTEENNQAKSYKRSKSEKVRKVAVDERKKTTSIVRRSETMEKHQADDQASTVEEADEFSTMSDEELNRRVEEFIQRFNKQIRRQSN